jgi:hypothetical protein
MELGGYGVQRGRCRNIYYRKNFRSAIVYRCDEPNESYLHDDFDDDVPSIWEVQNVGTFLLRLPEAPAIDGESHNRIQAMETYRLNSNGY